MQVRYAVRFFFGRVIYIDICSFSKPLRYTVAYASKSDTYLHHELRGNVGSVQYKITSLKITIEFLNVKSLFNNAIFKNPA